MEKIEKITKLKHDPAGNVMNLSQYSFSRGTYKIFKYNEKNSNQALRISKEE